MSRHLFHVGVLLATLLAASPRLARAQDATMEHTWPVGMRQVEYIDAQHGGARHLALAVFYPAVLSSRATPFVMPLFTNLQIYKDAPAAFGQTRHPLIMFSHGRGSNGLYYAWFAEVLASHGYIVAALDHYHANTYDATIAYLANKLWQRPVDIGLSITFLLHDRFWGRHIDADRIGVAGHSQGGFTALWVGGATVNPDKYLAFQRIWRNNQTVPAYLREELPLDARPALHVHDSRIKAVFAMAPGLIQTFGMDPAGLRHLTVPTYITVGAGDTQNARLRTTPSTPRNTFRTPSSTCFPGAWITRFSSTNATRKGETNCRRPASTRLASSAARSME